ncbi:hypothetical protein [Geodermatophilus saharensis]|uniref:hypothetical protein n=1 Tax=Geodermatophilus saharensis TaxID=1137994 RepID=UPI00113FD46E|nr:hypothetical protein [Geodermatophilus saharensis]
MAAASALLHLPLLGPGRHGVLSLAVGLACVACAVHLWRRPGPAAWSGHVAAAALMPAHLLLTPAGPGHHAGPAAVAGSAADAAAWAPYALLLLAGLGVALGLVRWAVGADVPLRAGSAQMPAAVGGRSGRRVPQA